MSIVETQFRIIPDPQNPKLWAYEPLVHCQHLSVVGGFRTAKEARKAFDKAKRDVRGRHD